MLAVIIIGSVVTATVTAILSSVMINWGGFLQDVYAYYARDAGGMGSYSHSIAVIIIGNTRIIIG